MDLTKLRVFSVQQSVVVFTVIQFWGILCDPWFLPTPEGPGIDAVHDDVVGADDEDEAAAGDNEPLPPVGVSFFLENADFFFFSRRTLARPGGGKRGRSKNYERVFFFFSLCAEREREKRVDPKRERAGETERRKKNVEERVLLGRERAQKHEDWVARTHHGNKAILSLVPNTPAAEKREGGSCVRTYIFSVAETHGLFKNRREK